MNYKDDFQKVLSHRIKEQALALGFDMCGIAEVDKMDREASFLESWLDKGFHGELDYMARNKEKRANPSVLVKGARSVVSVILNYYPSEQQPKNVPQIAKYAYGQDYHHIIKNKLSQLLEFIQYHAPQAAGRAFVDTAPVFDSAWAQRAGLGWIGKNTLLINEKYGSYILIGELILNIELVYDQPVTEKCRDCTKCIEACPTGALKEPYVLDVNRCISYLNKDYEGVVDKNLKKKITPWIFGCDICQDVCPWNRKSVQHNHDFLDAHPKLMKLSKEEWENISSELFNAIFKNTPVAQISYQRLKNNIKVIK